MKCWLNKPVYGYGIWPEKEKEISIDNKKFFFCPLTKEKQATYHIDLTTERISLEEATSLMNKYLSHLSWVSHQPYWVGNGFAGGSLKNTNFEREQNMLFTGMIIDFPDAFELYNDSLILRALAFYRQAKIAERYSLAYSCLSYYKILEIEKNNQSVDSLNSWISSKLDKVQQLNKESFCKLDEYSRQKNMSLEEFIYKGVRNEAAHYFTDSEINLDASNSRLLFGYALNILENLATFYIEEVLKVSDSLFSISCQKKSSYANNLKLNKNDQTF